MSPYRDGLVRVEPRALVAEAEPPPRGVRVRAWSDGTLRLLAPDLGRRAALFAGGIAVMVGGGIAAVLAGVPSLAAIVTPIGGGCLALSVHGFPRDVPLEGERIEVTPAAISWRRSAVDNAVRPLTEVSGVVVTGAGASARIELQLGRESLQLADGLGYDEATLRWIALRLRRALEAAR
jgi:hypothetical protein